MEDLSTLLPLLQAHAWLPVSAWVIGLTVRVLKDDTVLPTLPSAYRHITILFVVAMTVLPACGGSFEEARGPNLKLGASPELTSRCTTLDDRAAFYGGAAKGSAALSGVAGPSALLVKEDAQKLAIGIAGGVLGAVAVGAGFVSDSAATSWARECSR